MKGPALTLLLVALSNTANAVSEVKYQSYGTQLDLQQQLKAPATPSEVVTDSQPDDEEEADAANPAYWVLGLGLCSGLFCLGSVLWRRMSGVDGEVVERTPENLDEDVYGAGIATLVRDAYFMVDGKGDALLRCSRLLVSFGLTLFVIGLQSFVILQMKALVADRSLTVIRQIYDRYEFAMYGQDESHTYLTANGFHRGIDPKYFDMNNFELLSMDEKESACSIGFSQPALLLPILFIWGLTVISDLRRTCDLFVRLMVVTPTVDSMKNSTEEGDGEESKIVGLTTPVKSLLALTCFIPRVLIDSYLLWLGSVWLCATPSFTDLLLNSVALEFILLLKDALYNGVVPDRNKRATQNTLILPWSQSEPATYKSFISAFGILFLGMAWAWLFVYKLQAVLPDYKWDVHAACVEYIKTQTSGVAR